MTRRGFITVSFDLERTQRVLTEKNRPGPAHRRLDG